MSGPNDSVENTPITTRKIAPPPAGSLPMNPSKGVEVAEAQVAPSQERP